VHSGTLQNKLKKALDFDDGRLLSRVVHYMEVAGQLERRKHEKTHELYLKVYQQERQSPTTPPPDLQNRMMTAGLNPRRSEDGGKETRTRETGDEGTDA
jgi:hypothetical protein